MLLGSGFIVCGWPAWELKDGGGGDELSVPFSSSSSSTLSTVLSLYLCLSYSAQLVTVG